MSTTKGEICISYYVKCPHCSEIFDEVHDKEWFDETMGSDFPVDNGYEQEFHAKCPKCKVDFIIDGFQY
jgi:phage FluMu protein Com